MRRTARFSCAFVPFLLASLVSRQGIRAEESTSKSAQPGFGYVGPACVVVDGNLFLHGVSIRKLDKSEADSFSAYQFDLSLFKEALQSGDVSVDAPLVPPFCGGHDDSVEIVLKSCIVRNNHVYVGERLVRSLTNQEKQRVETAKSRRSTDESRRRIRRHFDQQTRPATVSDPSSSPQRDFSALIHRLLNVNATVTSRFLPVVSQSPMFAMDGPWQNLLGLGELKLLSSSATTTTTLDGDLSKIDTPYRWLFTTKPTQTWTTATTSTPRTTATPRRTTYYTRPTLATKSKTRSREISLHPIYTTTSKPVSKSKPLDHEFFRNLRRRPSDNEKYDLPKSTSTSTTTTTMSTPPKIHFGYTPSQWDRDDSKTVVDPMILELISRALANNQLLETVEPPATASVPYNGFLPVDSALKLRFIAPPTSSSSSSWSSWPSTSLPQSPGAPLTQSVAGPAHNNAFMPHLAYTSLARGDHRLTPTATLQSVLPDDICQ